MRLEEFDGKKGERKFDGKKGDEEEKFYSFDEDIIYLFVDLYLDLDSGLISN